MMKLAEKFKMAADSFCCTVCNVINTHPSCEELEAFARYTEERPTLYAECHAKIHRHLKLDQCPTCRQEFESLCLYHNVNEPAWWTE